MDLVKKISTFNNFNLLVDETLALLKKTNLSQISIQSNGSWDESAGWLKSPLDEFKFVDIHPDLKNTVFDEYIKSFPFKIYRTRIMVLEPFGSYSLHKDPTPRIHTPILTHSKTAFLFPQNNYMYHMPADGSIYWTDTTKEHTFVNYSDQHRIHIVSVVI